MTYHHSRSLYGLAAILFVGALAFFFAATVPRTVPAAPFDAQQKALVYGVVYLIAAVLAFGYQHFRRVETDTLGIRIYGLFNMKLFAANWKEIVKLERTKKEGFLGQETWTLHTANAQGRVPRHVVGYGDLMRFLAMAVPDTALPKVPMGIHRGNPSDVTSTLHRGGTTREMMLAAGAFIWIFGGLTSFCAMGMIIPNKATAADTIPAFVQMACLGLLPLPFLLQGLKGSWKRASSVNEVGIQEDDAYGSKEIGWNDISFAEVRSYVGPLGLVTELVVASPFGTIILDRSEQTYREAVYGVCQLAPPTALVIPPAKGFE